MADMLFASHKHQDFQSEGFYTLYIFKIKPFIF